ncbi:hypothetical protein MPC1_130006 [Methylocella tundrae]|nr:hypothetical protein MPC1_130006 [Methylocella tundrae]
MASGASDALAQRGRRGSQCRHNQRRGSVIALDVEMAFFLAISRAFSIPRFDVIETHKVQWLCRPPTR